MGDEQLMTWLREAVADAAPLLDDVVRQGRGVYPWRTIDEDLARAALIDDTEWARCAQLRAGPVDDALPRTVVFEAPPDTSQAEPRLSVEVEIEADRLLGQLLPTATGQVRLEGPDGAVIFGDIDEFGFFVLDRPATGPVRLRCRTKIGTLLTDWFAL